MVAMIRAAAAKIGSMNRRVLSEMSNMMEVLSIAEVGSLSSLTALLAASF